MWQQQDGSAKLPACCRLLTLPLELRLMIWGFAVGGENIAVFRGQKGLLHEVLDEGNSRTPGDLFNINTRTARAVARQIRTSLPVPAQTKTRLQSGRFRPLALSCTCKLMYSVTLDFSCGVLLTSCQLPRDY